MLYFYYRAYFSFCNLFSNLLLAMVYSSFYDFVYTTKVLNQLYYLQVYQ